MMATATDAPCTKCGRVDPLADFEGQELCNDCWHTARQATPPYHVVSKSNPHSYSHGAGVPVVYTLAEATVRAAAMNADTWSSLHDFEPKLAGSWAGQRIAHPGFGRRRRAEILATHPEYAAKDGG
jgi:hypothetical protein